MFGKYNGFVSKAWVSACMYFLLMIILSSVFRVQRGVYNNELLVVQAITAKIKVHALTMYRRHICPEQLSLLLLLLSQVNLQCSKIIVCLLFLFQIVPIYREIQPYAVTNARPPKFRNDLFLAGWLVN